MTVAFNRMEFRPVGKFRTKVEETVYNYDSRMYEKEYIALPTDYGEYGENRVTFQRAMKVTILMGQIFGLFPVLGVCGDDVTKIRFTYQSGRFFYSVLSIIGQSILVFFCIFKIFWDVNASLNSNCAVVFFLSNSIVTLFFIRVAMKWANLSRNIAKIEAVDPNTDKHLILKCNVTCIGVILIAAVEHGLNDLSGVATVLACQPDKPPYESYLIQSYYWIWAYVPYNRYLGFFAKFVSIQCTFNWNYSDTFIMCICWYLSARLQQINDRISNIGEKVITPNFWRTMREDYTKATCLVRQVDDIISGITLVSFGSNLFSICFLLLHTLELLSGYEHIIYYLFSISFLLIRSIMMSLMAARVNSKSVETAHALYEVPSDVFDDEVAMNY
ncbi:trehalose receptor domain-containing protein [Phthorimaea operculella]|nr:trehalose receptor domain-containing protein [Phthorimaea operculella]